MLSVSIDVHCCCVHSAPRRVPVCAPATMLTIRLRTRDGTERISVTRQGCVGDLRNAVSEQVERPPTQFVLSTDNTLVRQPPSFHQISRCFRA